jgi:hypothetical protein
MSSSRKDEMGNNTATQNGLAQWWRERERKWPWVVAAAILLLFVISGVFGDDDSRGGHEDQPVATLPDGLPGMNAASARDQLEDQGFVVTLESVDGRMVIVESNWNVVSASLQEAKNVLLRVAKPTPTTTAPPALADVPSTTGTPPAEVTSERAPEPEPVPDPTPEEEPEPAPAPDVYYANCAEARAAGAAPLAAGEPGYRPGLDRDKDGIACDS